MSSVFPGNTRLQHAIERAYPLGSPGLATPHDQVIAIFTDYHFDCPAGKLVNATTALNIPAWRYNLNTTFPNNQPLLNQNVDLGAWHTSELYLIFGFPYFPNETDTAQEAAMSQAMMKAWAGFAKDPAAGPGWTQVGEGADDVAMLGMEEMEILSAREVDARCHLYENDAGTTA